MKIKLLAAILISAVTFLWLSGRICGDDANGRGPRDDLLFDADMALYTKILSGPTPNRPSPLHGLLNFVYRPPTLLLAKILGASSGDDGRAGLIATRILLAAFCALGIAALVRIAKELEVEDRKLLILFPMFLLATSNLLACTPESYGLSYGLLAVTAFIILKPTEPARKAEILAAMSFFCAGTTITNALYPGGAILYLLLVRREDGGIRPRWLTNNRISAIILSPLVLALAMLPLIRTRFSNFYNHIFSWMHMNLFRRPGRALLDALYDLIYPVVSAYPATVNHQITYRIPEGVTWTWVHVAAAVAWGILLCGGIVEGLRSPVLRTFTLGLILWVGFNLFLHSLWSGPDHGLYMPHWSWSLLILATIAARPPRDRGPDRALPPDHRRPVHDPPVHPEGPRFDPRRMNRDLACAVCNEAFFPGGRGWRGEKLGSTRRNDHSRYLVFVAQGGRPLTRPSGTLSPLPPEERRRVLIPQSDIEDPKFGDPSPALRAPSPRCRGAREKRGRRSSRDPKSKIEDPKFGDPSPALRAPSPRCRRAREKDGRDTKTAWTLKGVKLYDDRSTFAKSGASARS